MRSTLFLPTNTHAQVTFNEKQDRYAPNLRFKTVNSCIIILQKGYMRIVYKKPKKRKKEEQRKRNGNE